MRTREPVVAGLFYASNRSVLREQIERCFLGRGGPGALPQVNPSGERRILGLVSPHAGYIYSGMIAAHAYAALAEDGLPDTAILIGPNHHSYIPAVALTQDEAWRTPLGEIMVDSEMNEALASAFPSAEGSSLAHQEEHSIEVQIPFLQYLADIAGKEIRILPILLGNSAVSGSESFPETFGSALSSIMAERNTMIIASSDFTHYETGESVTAKDSRALSKILELDATGLVESVRSFNITMCGVLPAAVTIAACKTLGATSAEKMAYGNSGDVSGDYTEVVGYAALKIHK